MTGCDAYLVEEVAGRKPYMYECMVTTGPDHPGNHRHVAQSGVVRVWRGSGVTAELVDKVRVPDPGRLRW